MTISMRGVNNRRSIRNMSILYSVSTTSSRSIRKMLKVQSTEWTNTKIYWLDIRLSKTGLKKLRNSKSARKVRISHKVMESSSRENIRILPILRQESKALRTLRKQLRNKSKVDCSHKILTKNWQASQSFDRLYQLKHCLPLKRILIKKFLSRFQKWGINWRQKRPYQKVQTNL